MEGDLDGAEDALEQSRSLMVELGGRNDNVMIGLRLADVAPAAATTRALGPRWPPSWTRASTTPRRTPCCGSAWPCSRIAPATPPQRGSWPTRRCERARRGGGTVPGRGTSARWCSARSACSSSSRATARRQSRCWPSPTPWPWPQRTCRSSRPSAWPSPPWPPTVACRSAAEILGAAARLRGAEDATHPEVARLTVELRDALGDAGFADAYGRVARWIETAH